MKKLLRKARKYQVDALMWSDTLEHPGFFHEQRLGKCLVSLRFLKRRKIKGPILIVTSDSAFDGWIKDLKHEKLPVPIELTGTTKKRDTLLNQGLQTKNPIFILNKEGWIAVQQIAEVPWFSIILDESRFIANPKSKVSRFFVNNFRQVTHRIILTGTADFKDKLDYFQQLQFLDERILPYKDYWAWRATAFHSLGYDFILKKHHNNVLQKALSKNTHIIKRADQDYGRTKSHESRYITLPAKAQKIYDTLEEEFVLEYDTKELKFIYATIAHINLMRICGGMLPDKIIHNEKIKVLKELFENELHGEQVVICCRFILEIGALHDYFKKKYKSAVIYGDVKKSTRQISINKFNEGKIQLLFCEPEVIAHGSDLAKAETMIYYSQPNGAEPRAQSEDRIITMQDNKNVLIIDVLVKDTVDQDTREGYILNNSRRQIFDRAVNRWKR